MLTLKDLKEALDSMDQNRLFARFAPHKYIVPAGYVNPRLFGMLHFDSSTTVALGLENELDSTRRVSLLLGNELQKKDYPAFFVSPELTRVALRTAPPKDIPLHQVRWPLPALRFMFPGQTLKSELGTVINWGIIGRIRQPGSDLDQVMTLMEMEEPGGTLSWYHSHVPIDEKYRNVTIPELTDMGTLNEVSIRTVDAGLCIDPENDTRLNNAGVTLLFNLLLIMTASPALVEKGSCLRKASERSGHVHELWSPHFLGRNYRVQKAPPAAGASEGGHHASPRLHWRRGHFRGQPHGPRTAPEIRVIWIEPMLINAPEPVKT